MALFSQSYQFNNFSLKEGLPQSQVFCIHEDENGYLWMGTRGGGIARFNGLEFVTFTTKDSLAGNYINAIASGKQYIWAATNSGLSVYTQKKWRSVQRFQGMMVQDILFQNDALWIIAEGELVYQ